MKGFFRSRPRLAIVAATLLSAAGVAAVGGALFVALGVYNVAASEGHSAPTRALLEVGMRRSVQAHAPRVAAPSAEDAAAVQLGAAHFHGACQPCHGAPGAPAAAILRAMLPAPPDLAATAPSWSDGELFFIVKHGVRYTGMPAWTAPARDDEVLALVAFLRRLPELDPDAYRRLAFGNATPDAPEADEILAQGPEARALAACARCHDAPGSPPASALTPALGGQHASYIEDSLHAYASGERASGIMRPVATALTPDQIAALAAVYAARPAPAPQAAQADRARAARGARIATRGAPGSAAPPCLSCHGESPLPFAPRLHGRSARYLEQQLALFKAERRGGSGRHVLMNAIAQRLSDEEIADVAAYFAASEGGEG